MKFNQVGSGRWVGRVGRLYFYLDDDGGQVNARQAAAAAQIEMSLPALEAKGAGYLDSFVDRARTSGKAEAEWWLDEIEFQGRGADEAVVYSLCFSLEGDDSGIWTVDMRVFPREHRPFRLERLQG